MGADLEADVEADIVIIGSGVGGSAIAWSLAKSGARVLVSKCDSIAASFAGWVRWRSFARRSPESGWSSAATTPIVIASERPARS